jgi:hypothetical protein
MQFRYPSENEHKRYRLETIVKFSVSSISGDNRNESDLNAEGLEEELGKAMGILTN